MSEPTSTSPAPDLQFDRAVSTTGAEASGVTCSGCGRAIAYSYYTFGDKPYCVACKSKLETALGSGSDTAALVKAIVYGTGAAVAGAAIYFAVMVFMHLEIGLVAILIGYMVGKAMRKAAIAGGQKYQILAAALTYAAVGLAYAAALQSFEGFIYPITDIASGGGILSAIIIGFGMRQAWRMMTGINVEIVGPLKVAQPAPQAVSSND